MVNFEINTNDVTGDALSVPSTLKKKKTRKKSRAVKKPSAPDKAPNMASEASK